MVENTEDKVWMFGFGSNMDVENAVKVKKGVPVSDHVGAIAKGWRMAFNLPGIPCCEPWFANSVRGSETDEIHGVAFCTTTEGMKKMDDQEGVGRGGYDKVEATFDAYDGRTLQGWMYYKEKESEGAPSARYLGVLLKGAREANLKAEYIEKLSKHPTFTPDETQVSNRSLLPDPSSLPKMTCEELAALPQDETAHTSMFGYIMKF
jgi:hypothetical protein